MEIIPADDGSSDANAAPAATLGANPAVHEPLSVELLEDRVLLASDAAAAGTPAPGEARTESNAYVAAPVVGEPAVALTADVADTGAAPGASPPASGASDQSHVPAVEVPHEVVERPGPENSQTLERSREGDLGESGMNEFGLATIEPEERKSIRGESGKRLQSGDTLAPPASQRAETELAPEESTLPRSLADAQGDEQPTLAAQAIAELGRERPMSDLATSLAEETAIAPLLDDGPTSEIPSHERRTGANQENVLVAISNPVSDAAGPLTEPENKGLAAAQPPDGKIAASELLGRAAQPDAVGATEGSPTATAAHDAVFAGGGGVEAMIDHVTSDQTTH